MVPEEGEVHLKKRIREAKLATAKQFNLLDFLDHCIDFLNNPNLYDLKLIMKSARKLSRG
jgi:hypothetical protein